ncbi:MAG: tetratricopeptide repeat protein [Verrucomicrobia bacterium]|nr:tetratricopeptide repeat protein [Verrucomicrobiota bacterium]
MSSTTAQPQGTPAPDSGPGFDLLTWLEINRRLVVGVVLVVSVVLAVLAVVRSQQRATRAAAAKELLQIIPPVGPGEAQKAPDVAKLLALSGQFPATAAGQQARLLAAGQLFVSGKYAEAQSEFSRFEEQNPNSEFVGVALIGIAAALEAQGKDADAVKAYDRAILGGGDGFAVQARLAKARLLESTSPAVALGLIDEGLKNAAASVVGEQAATARTRLVQKHPELATSASTNAPSLAPAGASGSR